MTQVLHKAAFSLAPGRGVCQSQSTNRIKCTIAGLKEELMWKGPLGVDPKQGAASTLGPPL